MHLSKIYMPIILMLILMLSLRSGMSYITTDDVPDFVTSEDFNYLSQNHTYTITSKDDCFDKGVWAFKKVNGEFYSFKNPPIDMHKYKNKSMFSCFQKTRTSNFSDDLLRFDNEFLSNNYTVSSGCQQYQNVFKKQMEDSSDAFWGKAGDINGFNIHIITPKKHTHFMILEHLMQENIKMISSMFREKVESYNPLGKYTSVPETSGLFDYITQTLNLIDDAALVALRDQIWSNDKYSIKGPVTLGYLLSQQIRCMAKGMIPDHIKEDLDEIEHINNDWLVFDIERTKVKPNQNLTIVFDTKTESLNVSLSLSDTYAIKSLLFNDKLIYGQKFFETILQENVIVNPDPNCDKQESIMFAVNTPVETVTQNNNETPNGN